MEFQFLSKIPSKLYIYKPEFKIRFFFCDGATTEKTSLLQGRQFTQGRDPSIVMSAVEPNQGQRAKKRSLQQISLQQKNQKQEKEKRIELLITDVMALFPSPLEPSTKQMGSIE